MGCGARLGLCVHVHCAGVMCVYDRSWGGSGGVECLRERRREGGGERVLPPSRHTGEAPASFSLLPTSSIVGSAQVLPFPLEGCLAFWTAAAPLPSHRKHRHISVNISRRWRWTLRGNAEVPDVPQALPSGSSTAPGTRSGTLKKKKVGKGAALRPGPRQATMGAMHVH